jgi:two-component system, NtrC family, sensor kinase
MNSKLATKKQLSEELTRLHQRIAELESEAALGKTKDEALRERESFNFALFQYNPVPTVIVDNEGRVVKSNLAKRRSGYRLPEIGDYIYLDYAAKHAMDMRAELMDCINTGQVKEFPELEYGDKVLSISIAPFSDGAMVMSRDVTERKRAEELLKQREDHFRSLIENSSDVIMILNAEAIIDYCSPSTERLTGYKPVELIGKNALEFVHPEELTETSSVLAHGIEIPEYTTLLETRLRHKDGIWRYTELIGKNLINVASVGGVVLNFRDITERKQAEAEQRRLFRISEEKNQIITAANIQLEKTLDDLKFAHEELQRSHVQLLQSEKLAAIGQLVSGVAHELNSPLMAIYVCSELMLRYVEDTTTRQDLQNLHSDTERAITIVRNLLSFARKHEPERKIISINECIQSVLSLRTYELRLNDIEIVEEFDHNLPQPMADYQQLQQVFMNLTINAEQAMKESLNEGRIVIRTRKAENLIRVTFTDSGPGIPPDILGRVFEPFFTTKQIGEGTGLGLSICYGIIQEHGGQIYAQSNERCGTTLTVELPVVAEGVCCGPPANHTEQT